MRKRRGIRGQQDDAGTGPDCTTCIHARGCERYAENSFCTRWQGRAPEKREPDPNELWKQGEEVEF